jgi:hypothetical protein
LPADSAQRSDQPDVPDRVRELCPPGRLEIRQQVELTTVVGAVAAPAERYDTQGVTTPAERSRNQVRRVDPLGGAADDASVSEYRGALALACRH